MGYGLARSGRAHSGIGCHARDRGPVGRRTDLCHFRADRLFSDFGRGEHGAPLEAGANRMSAADAARQVRERTPSLLVNGRIATMEPAAPSPEALLTDGERIAFIGRRSDAEAMAATLPRTDLVDL